MARQPGTSGAPSDAHDPLMTLRRARRTSWRWTFIGLAVLVIAVIVRARSSNPPPPLATSCVTPAFALSSTTPDSGSDIEWAATGPAATRFAIGVGIASMRVDPSSGQLHAVPEPGHADSAVEQAVAPTVMPPGCTTNGRFRVSVPAGHYTARLFRISGTGSAVTVTAVATKQLAVG
jgi:hypothetical protein